jgi:hypothetical protein
MSTNLRQLEGPAHWREPDGAIDGKRQRCKALALITLFENGVLVLESCPRRFESGMYSRTWRPGIAYVFVGSVFFALSLLVILFLH